MSKRTSSAANGAQAKLDAGDSVTGPLCTRPPPPPTKPSSSQLTRRAAADTQKKDLNLLAAEGGHFSLIKAMHLADLITEMNGKHLPSTPCHHHTRLTPNPSPTGLCGILSIFSSLRYCAGDQTSHTNLWAALSLLPLGLFFDFFDGKVARWRHKSSLMGQELDSLADLVRPHPPTPNPPHPN